MRFHNTVVFIFTALQGHSDVVHALPSQDWSQSGERVGGEFKPRALADGPPPPPPPSTTDVVVWDSRDAVEERGLQKRTPEWMKTFNDYFTFIGGLVVCVGAISWAGRRLTLTFTSQQQRDRFYACVGSAFGWSQDEARDVVHSAGEFGAELQEVLPP